jgi:two-component system, NarL family, nitrate/nitrite response regulator NarL
VRSRSAGSAGYARRCPRYRVRAITDAATAGPSDPAFTSSGAGPISLVICDGNRILGEALAAALEARDREVSAVATSTADDCVAAVSSCRPDICVLDPHLSEAEEGLRVIREIRDRCPGVAVLVVSDVRDPAILAQARRLGIAGFLGKNRSVSQLADALDKVAGGQPVFDPVPVGASHPTVPFVLTPREAEVLRRIGAGQHTRQMSREMNIATSTLRTYVKNVFAKLGVHSRLEAAAVASRANLLGEISARPLAASDQQKFLHSA